MAEIKLVLEDDENNRIEIEAGKLGITKAGFFRLLFKNWMGEVRLERKPDSNNSTENSK